MIDFNNVQRLSLIGLLSLTAATHAGLPSPPGASDSESICGSTIDWQDVEQYDGTLGVTNTFVNNLEGAVGAIRWNNNLASTYSTPGNVAGVGWCTGTLISPNLFLTAGHCFDVQPNDGVGWDFPVSNATGQTISSEEAAINMSVFFGYQNDANGITQDGVHVAIQNLVEYRYGGLDYAIAVLEEPVDASPTSIASYLPSNGERVAIIQHPAGNPKVVDAGFTNGTGTAGRLLYNQLDTTGGSSGSGVLDANGDIIAVHTNGGCNFAGGNQGVLIKDIEVFSPIIDQILNVPSQPPVYWTNWLDRDNPSGSGDYEIRKDFSPGQVCEHPVAIQARVRGSNDIFVPFESRAEVFGAFSADRGLVCRNKDQTQTTCKDYQVRFMCPQGEWTDWLNRDRPGGSGDWEGRAYFSQGTVCDDPTDIKARVKGGSTIYSIDSATPDNLLRFTADYGLACRNKDQSGSCNDYEVKFLCP